jgi:hypothetical protein
MPRLTNPDYLHYHQLLRTTWWDDARCYDRLSMPAQLALFDFFLPHRD